jgi:hypothetical protein
VTLDELVAVLTALSAVIAAVIAVLKWANIGPTGHWWGAQRLDPRDDQSKGDVPGRTASATNTKPSGDPGTGANFQRRSARWWYGLVLAFALVFGGVVAGRAYLGTGGASTPAASITFTSPANGTPIIGHIGVLLTGVIRHRGGRVLRIFDHPIERQDHSYYLDTPRGIRPQASGDWSFRDGPIGDPRGDDNKVFEVIAIAAGFACNAQIAGAEHAGELTLPALPSFCRTKTHRDLLFKRY